MSASPALDLASALVDQLAACGVRDFVVCPGSRSAPLALAAARHPEIRALVHVDERSAGFLALGLAKQAERPVALVCTSGTAAAEFLPAVVEANHSGVPLLCLTADRPPELHGVGANQTIDQLGIYGSQVRWAFDPGPALAAPGAEGRWRRLALRSLAEALGPPPGPVQLNLSFREPLVTPGPEPAALSGPRLEAVRRAPAEADRESVERLAEALQRSRRPMVVAGGMRRGEELAGPLGRLLRAAGALCLAEPGSQLRTCGLPFSVDAYDALLRTPQGRRLEPPDLVLRLGAAPTSKALGQFLSGAHPELVLVDPWGRPADPEGLATLVLRCPPGSLLRGLERVLPEGSGAPRWGEDWRRAAAAAGAALDRLAPSLPLFELHAVRALAQLLRRGTLWVGSSLPIRDVDAFWPGSDAGPRFLGNRGASGIDGFVSSVLGGSLAEPLTVGLLGDLTLFHDLGGLWAARRHRLQPKLVLLDNNGGGIFSQLPPAAHGDVFEEFFGTPLDFDLAGGARLHGFTTLEAGSPDEVLPATRRLLSEPGPALLRLGFDRAQSARSHQACWEAVGAALDGS